MSCLKHWLRRVANRVYPPTYVMGRVACLGQEVFQRLPGRLIGREGSLHTRHSALMNMQKMRCDALLEWINTTERPSLTPAAKKVIPHLERKDVAPLIEQQERMIWFDQLPFAYAIMDSFSELTDQRFRHRREGWMFSCHYTDLQHTPEFTKDFECLGLLPIERIQGVYGEFFKWFAKAHPATPLFFIHFPAVLDQRGLFKERASAILDAVTTLKRDLQAEFLYDLALPDREVGKAPGDNFAYHFDSMTFSRFAKLLVATYASG